MYLHFTSSWWVIPLFLAILFIYLCLCCKRKKRSEEMEESWEDAHPSSPDQHPYGSNTLFAPRPPALPSSNYDWGQKDENQCYQIPLPPPYQAHPPYRSLSSSSTGDQHPPHPIPRPSFSTLPPYPPPSYTSVVEQQKY